MRTNAALDLLEVKLKELRIEFEKYFNGANDLPPGDLQAEVERSIRLLRQSVKGSVDNFRLSSLEARFNSFNEMFNRRVRAVEEGRTPGRRREPTRPRYDAFGGITVDDGIGDGAAAALYQGLYDSSSKVDLDTFQGYLDRQAAAIRKKTGCAQVQFRLADEGGRVKLKAKAIR